jgi:Xaa-Pro dipeptidase
MNRRDFLATAAAAGVARAQQSVPDAIRNLQPMAAGVQPITAQERQARIEKARRLMRDNRIDAVVVESGSTLFYFTGTRQVAGAWVLPVSGEPIAVEGGSRAAAKAMSGRRRIGIEERVRFGTYYDLRKELPAAEFVSADPVTVGCRVIKSPAELALMQRANDVTIEAYKAAFTTFREGMTTRDLAANISAAHRALGFPGSAMVIFGKYTAFPHGSATPQQLREGDVILVDGGCSVDGYQSDVTRTTVFGKPSARQRQIWDLERRAQDAALAAAKRGATCESVDAAARKVIVDAGFGPGYKVPGLPHRTGHGIGLDGHEWTHLVKGNKTKLEPGMVFSNEPTIAIYGEFGVRLEDCMYIAESGATLFTRQSPAIDHPFG